MKDAERGPHETWCDTQNKISECCNCLASSYIDQIAELEAENARLRQALEQALRQWEMYMTDLGRDDAENLDHAEADEFRRCKQALEAKERV